MSRLNDLIRQARLKDPALADDLEREVAAVADRRAFGLNFERHTPEVVELPGRRVRHGDKVRVLPPRGTSPKKTDERVWRLRSIIKDGDGQRTARLESMSDDDQSVTVAVADLVVIAEFRDPIYPGMISTGKVERGGDKPFHTVINAENYHALQTLLFTHRGKVDCIYIDPPYNTGAKDWKYNNHYVEGEDLYRHSKWLAFMERRLLLAGELLNPDDSVLIVTIDEKEYLRLGLLLEQTFVESNIQMVSTVINPASSARRGEFGRSNEYIFICYLGAASPSPLVLEDSWFGRTSTKRKNKLRWQELSRRGDNGRRVARPNLYYPIFVHADGSSIHSVGEAIPLLTDREEATCPTGTVAIWPIRSDGSDGTWGRNPASLREAIAQGFVRLGGFTARGMAVYHMAKGEQEKVTQGLFEVTGRRVDGSIIVDDTDYQTALVPGNQWGIPSHDASTYGSALLRKFLPDRRFPFPKSLYAVEDVLRFFTVSKPAATVIDFFSGSGTTAHAVFRLNKQDGGHRKSISVTNNEVSASEQITLTQRGLRPGDADWEMLGISEFITKPRITAAVTGRTPAGEPVNGDYKVIDEFPMCDGFEENVEFFTLTYESPLRVSSHREFQRIAPLLWFRAGSRGRRIDTLPEGWDVADAYGVLADLDYIEKFVHGLAEHADATVAFIVTDEDRLFESMVRELPEHVEAVRLYEAYLRNFELESGRGAR